MDGKLEAEQGEINQPLICDWPNRPRQKIDHELGKASRTFYKLISFDDIQNTSRIELIPHTGRSHQLRVHMQFLGHSILGDSFYAEEPIAQKSPRLLLHAHSLEFIQPITQTRLHIVSPTPF